MRCFGALVSRPGIICSLAKSSAESTLPVHKLCRNCDNNCPNRLDYEPEALRARALGQMGVVWARR